MSGLLYLEADDFMIVKNTRGDNNILTIQSKGNALVLFYSTQCVHCQSLISVFKTLPKVLGGCQYGMINISKYKDCIAKSHQTNTPIDCVPYIIFYYNGKPYMRYKGEYDIESIKKFVIYIANFIQTKTSLTSLTENNNKDNPKHNIRIYSFGLPLYGDEDNVCYLPFETAYVNDQKKRNDPRLR